MEKRNMINNFVTCPCSAPNCSSALGMDGRNISPSMKLADVVEYNHGLLEVLSRLDIGFGFGEQTVADACAAHGFDVSAFILICNAYTFENYVPSNDLLASAQVGDIIKYLHKSHSVYLNEKMAVLEEELTELITLTDNVQKKIVGKFFADFRNEAANHFDYEESVTFPYISSLLSGERHEGCSMETIEENHDNMMEKLSDLKTIVMKYLPTSCGNRLRNRVLLHIFNLEGDLGHHILLEDDILMPIMKILEKNGH